MSGTVTEMPFELSEAVKNLVTEDDEPADNILSEKQQRPLLDALYESWTPPPAEPDEVDEGEGQEANAGPRSPNGRAAARTRHQPRRSLR